jgi:hypothetical protein
MKVSEMLAGHGEGMLLVVEYINLFNLFFVGVYKGKLVIVLLVAWNKEFYDSRR